MHIDLDLSNYKNRFGDYVPEGRYHVVVEDAEMAKSAKGNDMIVLYYRVVSDDEDTNGKTLVDRLTLTEAALFRVVGFLGALGIPTPKKKIRLDFARIINRHLEVDVEDREYNGRTSSNVAGYNRLKREDGAGAASTADLSDLEPDAPATDDAATDLPEPEEALAETTVSDRVKSAAAPEPAVAGEPETWDLQDIDL